jgi:hypothetical protein
MPTLPLRAFQRAPLQRGRAWQSLACDRSDERDAHHIDDTNSACSAGATRRQHRDVLARTGAIALEESEGRKKLRSPLLARHVTANLLQNASSKSMHERWRAARLSLQLVRAVHCVPSFAKESSLRSVTRRCNVDPYCARTNADNAGRGIHSLFWRGLLLFH